MNSGIIYCAYNKVNGKRYIGQTVQGLKKRKAQHYSHDGCVYFHRALMKYKEEDWEWTVIEEDLDKDALNEREKYWIQYYNTLNPDKGYNLSSGGFDGVLSTERIKELRDIFVQKWSTKPDVVRRSRNVRCIETGEVFKTAKDAGKAKNITYSHITEVANNVALHKTAGGYHWEWCIDPSFFPRALYCKELDEIYLTLYEANRVGHFCSNKLKQFLDEDKNEFVYADYTFCRINPLE